MSSSIKRHCDSLLMAQDQVKTALADNANLANDTLGGSSVG